MNGIKVFLAFLRLIGTVYFKKNGTGFDTNSPENHFKSFITPSGTAHDTHIQWLEDIRETAWAHVTNENETVPSVDVLLRHWKRSCWIVDMWKQADLNTIHLRDLASYGWTVTKDMDYTEH